MRPLDDGMKWIEKIHALKADEILYPDEQESWAALANPDKDILMEKLLSKPIVFEDPWVIYTWYFRSKWIETLKNICKTDSISVLEIGAGGNDLLPKAIAKAYPSPLSKYTTFNLNQELTGIFKAKTQNLPISIEVIEDDAQKIESYEGEDVFDVIVFEHSANDVIETILAEKNGIDTVHSDWMKILPQITDIVNREYSDKTLETNVKDDFLKLISTCLKVLKSDGILAINHYQFQYNLDIGLNPEWNENLLPIIRKWILDAKLGEEVFFEDSEPQWWMFLQKKPFSILHS